MKPEDLRSPAVQEFAGLVRRLNNIVGSLDTFSEIEMLEALDELLPLIYSAGHRLPDVYDDEDESEDEWEEPVWLHRTAEDFNRRRMDLRQRFGNMLGWHRIVRIPYDPFPGSAYHKDGTLFDLADGLADVSITLSDAFELYERGDERSMEQAIWDWKFGLVSGLLWARELVQMFPAIHILTHHHYDEYEERFTI